MKKIILSLLLLASTGAKAEVPSEIILKDLKCKGATLEMKLQVAIDNLAGAVRTVAWEVQDTETKKYSEFMGYLYSEGGLKEFRSTDLGSVVEVSGSLAVVRFGDKEEALLCK